MQQDWFLSRLRQPGDYSLLLVPNWHPCSDATKDPGTVRRTKQNVRSIFNTEQHVEYTHELELHLKSLVW